MGPRVASDGRLGGRGTGSGACTGDTGDGRQAGGVRERTRRGERMMRPLADGDEAVVCGEMMSAELDVRILDDIPSAVGDGGDPRHLRRGSKSSVGDGGTSAAGDGPGPGAACISCSAAGTGGRVGRSAERNAESRGVAEVETLAGNKGKYTALCGGRFAGRHAAAAVPRIAVGCAAVHGR